MFKCWLAGCLLAAFSPLFVFAQGDTRRIEVRATGDVNVPADEMHLSLVVTTSGDEFVAVKQRNDQLLSQILELVASQKLAQPVIESTTASFDYTPANSGRTIYYSKGEKQQVAPKNSDPFDEAPPAPPPPLHMSRRLTLRFDGLPQATEMLAKLTATDVVRKLREVELSPLQARVKDLIPHQSKALRLAVQAAKEKAAVLAEASNLKLGAALAIVEETTSVHPGSRIPALDPFADPFGRNVPSNSDGQRSSPFAFVAFAEEKPPITPDHLPAAQINVSVGVRIMFEATQSK